MTHDYGCLKAVVIYIQTLPIIIRYTFDEFKALWVFSFYGFVCVFIVDFFLPDGVLTFQVLNKITGIQTSSLNRKVFDSITTIIFHYH